MKTSIFLAYFLTSTQYLQVHCVYNQTMNIEMINLYSDYLISSFGKTTVTGISELLNGAYSHDQFTRMLSNNSFDSVNLWKLVKSKIREIETNDGVIILDDTIQEKRYIHKELEGAGF